ncbi:hypothetical protein AS031_15600 [Pseudarthrobacter enclensis]|uniref:Uncharacterized protein n=1 Tax=Pseudarthrobacter enclensis TaxID=993070 RepID=A0A0V8ID63_9MICC|nr:hypothetical protein AS031_15600 [Pseudarthrobacter enclensis]
MLSAAVVLFLHLAQVMSASAKPRLAGRQPSIRGGVPRVRTWPSGKGPDGKRGPRCQVPAGPMSKEP